MSTVPSGKVPVVCPTCSKKLLVPPATLGKQGRCPGCQSVFTLEAMYEAELSPSDGLTPLAPSSPYTDDDFRTEYKLSAPPPAMHNQAYAPPQHMPPQYNTVHQPFPNSNFTTPGLQNTGFQQSPYSSPAPAPRQGQGFEFNTSVLGGLLMMVGAVVWFFGALFLFNVFFIYPPVLFIFGLIAFFKGLFAGNLAGD